MSHGQKTYTLFSQTYWDSHSKEYKNIVTINRVPDGPLRQIVRKVNFPYLSPFSANDPRPCTKSCGLALASSCSPCGLMTVDEVPNLFSFLSMNGYTIDTSITKMLQTSDIQYSENKIICMIHYTK